VCDDIELHAEHDKIVKAKNASSLGEAHSRYHPAERHSPDALIDGKEATVDEAVEAAADMSFDGTIYGRNRHAPFEGLGGRGRAGGGSALGFRGSRPRGMRMRRQSMVVSDREQAIRYGILPEEQVRHWTEIEEGRFQPRRTRGSYRGRELA
jgi:hypothetical protein